MKVKFKDVLIFICCLITILMPCLAFADGDEPGISSEGTSDLLPSESPQIDTTNIESKLDEIIGTLQATPTEGNLEIVEPDTTVSVLRISASDTSGLHSVMLSLIGDYNPIVKDYTYQSTQGYINHSIDIQPDWSWIASAFVFVVVLYSVFRIIGVALGAIRG